MNVKGPSSGSPNINGSGKKLKITSNFKVRMKCGGYCGYCEPSGGKNMNLLIA